MTSSINKAALWLLVVSATVFQAHCTDVMLTTGLGTLIGNTVTTTFMDQGGNVNSFLGIPYAEPPNGTRRFMKPVKKGALQDPFHATDLSPACPQDLFMINGWVPGKPNIGDDCLTLNIYAPEKVIRDPKRNATPVMLWIYGGAYVIGQSSIYSAENLTLIGDVIVVTMNYRLSSMGFLSTGSSKYPGNLAMWDQQMAIQWVHDHISDFGGDPNRVTVFGESAGGSSAIYQALYPGNNGLFQRIIAISGSPFCPWAFQPNPQRYARLFADRLNCTDPDLDKAVDCLQTKDYMTISQNGRVGNQDETVFRSEWDPSIDGEFITKTPEEMFKGNIDMFRHLDFMVGLNNNDGAFVTLLAVQPYMEAKLNRSFETGIPRDFFQNFLIDMIVKDMLGKENKIVQEAIAHTYTNWTDPDNELLIRDKFLELASDYNFFIPVLKTLLPHAAKPTSFKSFLYELDYRASFNSAPAYVTGSGHGDDLPFEFGFPLSMADGMRFHDNVPDSEKMMSKEMMIMFSNFAKSGDPNTPVPLPNSAHFPQFNKDTQEYMHITKSGFHAGSHFLGERAAFWFNFEEQLASASTCSSH